MIPGRGVPVTRPVLAVVPDVSGPDPGNTPSPAAPGPVTQAGNTKGGVTESTSGNTAAVTASPGTPGAVVPMSPPERARLAAARWAGAAAEAARELWFRPGGLIHVIIHGRAETMTEHRDYVKSRAWVPDGMTGNAGKAVIAAGVLHHLLIGRPVKAAMKAVKFAAEKIDQAADRPLRLYLTAALVVALFVLLARYL